MANVLKSLLLSKTQPFSSELQELGLKIGRLYTDNGLPIDMSLARLDYTNDQKLSILDGACQWLISHKRKSGATDKAIHRQRRANVALIESFLKTGETGVY